MAEATEDIIDKLLTPAKSTIEKIYEPIEGVLDSIGLMKGAAAPARRMVFGFALGSALTYMAKPKSMYDAKGRPRPWSVLDPASKNASPVQWWMPGTATGIVLGLFV